MKDPFIPHARYSRQHPLLRELVRVHVYGSDGQSFDSLLTRVPSIGEEISRDAHAYRITRVRHEPVDDDGRARIGYHAFVDADFLLLDEPKISRRRKTSDKTKPARPERDS